MKELKVEIDESLRIIIDRIVVKESSVKEAMKYSLLDSGKRIRPIFAMMVMKAYGKDYRPYLDVFGAIEMIHTYSLIHDDLPALDNDDLRRGKPTCHKKFNEAIAILAGDGLLNEAYLTIANADLEASKIVKIIKLLSYSAGSNGMIYGQIKDIEGENKQLTLDQLEDIHVNKTGMLIRASFGIAALIVGQDFETWLDVGHNLGLAFQIQDDILDVTQSSEVLGKNAMSDIENDKSTYVKLLGLEASYQKVDEYFNNAYQLIASLDVEASSLIEIINYMKERNN